VTTTITKVVEVNYDNNIIMNINQVKTNPP